MEIRAKNITLYWNSFRILISMIIASDVLGRRIAIHETRLSKVKNKAGSDCTENLWSLWRKVLLVIFL